MASTAFIPRISQRRLASPPRCQSPLSPCRRIRNHKRSLHRNQQCSITAITDASDASDAIAERYAYSAYGTPTITDAGGNTRTTTAIGNRYTYTGREWDDTLALYHYRARMYDSMGGRFSSRDPANYHSGDTNLFRFVFDNPLFWLDPFGLEVHINLIPEDEDIHHMFNQFDPPDGVFCIAAHGNPGGCWGPDELPLSSDDLIDLIRGHQDFKPGMPIMIYSCRVGSGMYPQEIANSLGCKISAPRVYFWLN